MPARSGRMDDYMPRTSEFYKGRRKKRNYAIIPGVALLLLGSILIVLFYSAQKYAVISDDGVSIELPLLTSGTATFDKNGEETAVFEQALHQNVLPLVQSLLV